jgi:hypothetical protein
MPPSQRALVDIARRGLPAGKRQRHPAQRSEIGIQPAAILGPSSRLSMRRVKGVALFGTMLLDPE